MSHLKASLEKLYKRKLSEGELFRARQNLAGFFNVLIKIDQQQKKSNEQNN